MKNVQMLNMGDGAASRNIESGDVGARQDSTCGAGRAPNGHRLDGSERRAPKLGQPNKSKKVTADEVLRSFNTWAFKREQPSDQDMLQQFVAESIERDEPVSFVLYWGKGPRDRVDAPDIACLDYLNSLGQRVGSVYEPGAAFTLIFTDTHAKLNGYTPQSAQRYFSAIESRAHHQYGFSGCLLGHLTKAALDEGPVETVTEVPADIREILLDSANKWYRGEGSVEQGALKYYNCNMVERRAVELAFPRSIFITFNGSKLLNLFPSRLPIFYMYSLRRGFSIKPWFLSVDFTATDAPARERVA